MLARMIDLPLLNLHAAEAEWYLLMLTSFVVKKLKLHAAEADGVSSC